MSGRDAGGERSDEGVGRELFEHIYGLLNEHELRYVDEVFTEDVIFQDDAWPTVMHGRAEVKEFLSAIWTAAPDFRFELVEGPYVSPDGDHAAARIRVEGTFTGSYRPPGLHPTNAPMATEFGAFYEFVEGRIRRERVILNMYSVGVQYGPCLPPAPAGNNWLWSCSE